MPGLNLIAKDSVAHTVIVAVALCLVCSVIVSTAAVSLKPLQTANQKLDRQKNILSVVDLLEPGKDPQALYDRYVEPRVVDLETGEFVDDIDPAKFDPREAARDPARSTNLSSDEDIADIKRRADYATVYLVKDKGELQYVVLPVHGYGLWSTLYGFIALESDLNTVYGLTFYDHAETPGLGGEVDNPKWKNLWQGKKIFDEPDDSKPALRVVKGSVASDAPEAEHKVDGLSGATLTSRGVTNMVRFWFGEMGYQPLLNRLGSDSLDVNSNRRG